MGDFKFTTREKTAPNIARTLSAKEKQPVHSAGQTNPVNSTTKQKQDNPSEKKNLVKVQKNSANKIISKTDSEVEQIVKAVITAKNSIVEEVSASFEQKIEKLDEAIVELISCKAENERLKGKIDNLIKENYKLKKEIKSFRSIMPGFFIKVKKDEIDL